MLVSTNGNRANMRIVNADRSVPEMCGNGIRCVALHLLLTGRIQAEESIVIDTESGPHACRVLPTLDAVEVTMRAPVLVPASVPVVADTR